MKRSNEQGDTDEIGNNSSSGSDSSDSSSSKSVSEGNNTSSKELKCDWDEGLTDNEKQIVRLSLATITKANMYDWDLDNSPQDIHYMTLCHSGVIYDNCKIIPCELTIEISYTTSETDCRIFYNIDDTHDIIDLNWETSNAGSKVINISKDVTSRCLIFSSTSTYWWGTQVKDSRNSAWCYFIDARYHLNRISN